VRRTVARKASSVDPDTPFRLIWRGNPLAADYSIPPMQGPSAAHWFGTDQQGHDVFLQMVDGTRPTLVVGFTIGIGSTLLSILIGVSAGYYGGWIDELLSLLMNVVLVIPGLPLVIVLSSWIQVRNDAPIILVITLTGWAWAARVLRSQALSIRQKDYVQAAIVRGESSLRIVLREILPNMISLVVSGFIGTTVAAIGYAASLQFMGFGNLAEVNWFTILYWAENASALQQGAWWMFMIPGGAIALVGMACALMNYGIDEISNPRLHHARSRSELRPSARSRRHLLGWRSRP